MLELLSLLFYICVLLPIWAARRVFGLSRFERRFHARNSAWDMPISLTNPVE